MNTVNIPWKNVFRVLAAVETTDDYISIFRALIAKGRSEGRAHIIKELEAIHARENIRDQEIIDNLQVILSKNFLKQLDELEARDKFNKFNI